MHCKDTILRTQNNWPYSKLIPNSGSILDEKPDFSTLLSYGNESVMLDKLIAETEKEMQAVKDAEQRKDLQELDTLTHHLRSSWQILRADQPLRELYAQLHGSATPDDEAICKAVTGCAG